MQQRKSLGIALVVVGLICALVGYQQSRPTLGEQVISGLASFAHEDVPDGLKPNKTVPYTLLYGGIVVALYGGYLAMTPGKASRVAD